MNIAIIPERGGRKLNPRKQYMCTMRESRLFLTWHLDLGMDKSNTLEEAFSSRHVQKNISVYTYYAVHRFARQSNHKFFASNLCN